MIALTDRLALRPTVATDEHALYALAAATAPSWARLASSVLPQPEHFAQAVGTGVLYQAAVIWEQELLVGCTELYSYRPGSGAAWMTVVVAPGSEAETARRLATEATLDHAFGQLELRKLSTVHYGFYESALKCIACEWHEEVRIPDALWCRGQYWAEVTSSVFSRDWQRSDRSGAYVDRP